MLALLAGKPGLALAGGFIISNVRCAFGCAGIERDGEGMSHHGVFFIGGAWRRPCGTGLIDVIDPATEKAFSQVCEAGRTDIDDAIAAAKRAFSAFEGVSVAARLELLESILHHSDQRQDDLAEAVSREMGAPLAFAKSAHVSAGAGLSRIHHRCASRLQFRRDARLDLHRARSDRRVRADHAVETGR